MAIDVPTLSQVRSLDTSTITDSASFWERVAWSWENTFTESANQIATPGGTLWEGQAADAARSRAESDLRMVRQRVWELQDAAVSARMGAEQMMACKRALLEAVDNASAIQLKVSDDWAIRETRRWELDPDRVTAMKQHAEYIQYQLIGLLSCSNQLANTLSTVSDSVSGLSFAPGRHARDVQAVSFSSGRMPEPPQGVIWCLRPGGMGGKYRCSVLNGDLSVQVYWSFTDDSGGF